MKRATVVLLGMILSQPLANSTDVSTSATRSGTSTGVDADRLGERNTSGANLIAIIGKRIDVRRVEHKSDQIPFDTEYLVMAEVLEVVFGSYSKKEITFSSYVHIGPAAFEKNEFGLVYVSEEEGRLVQQKYLFQPVYPTNDGRWASCGDPYFAISNVHRHGVKAEAVAFRPPVIFNTASLSKANAERKYSEPFFRHREGEAICLLGNYPPELFRVMKEGYLTARGVFGQAAPEHLEPSNPRPKADLKKLMKDPGR
jgi:hypothetical protein